MLSILNRVMPGGGGGGGGDLDLIMTPSSLIWGKVELPSLRTLEGEVDKHPLYGSHLTEWDDYGKGNCDCY